MTDRDNLRQLAARGRAAQRELGTAPAAQRSGALEALADILRARSDELLAANARDLEAARRAALAPALLGRLKLDAGKIDGLVDSVRQLAGSDDPVGRIVARTELDSGLVLRQLTSPIGVLLVIFESRPDAVIQIGALALRSGNAVLLKGGAEAGASNRALIACLRDALSDTGLAPAAVQGVEGREEVAALLGLDDMIDLVIPRGSNALVRHIQSSTRIPVLGHADGICHLYIDASADPAMATRVAIDSKCDYPAACNAVETLLVHEHFLPHWPALADQLRANGVELHADARARAVSPDAIPATEADWRTEYGALVLAVRTVANLDEAIAHIHEYGSGHTDAIVTGDTDSKRRFLAEVDSASVFANASTRFADGYRYGLGAEVGISTARIHARGPVGVDGLMTTRWLLEGDGQVAADYGPGRRRFTHRRLSGPGN